MSKQIKTYKVERYRAKNFLKKATELYQTMNNCYDNGLWNACVITAIHCGISGMDAFTVAKLGQRHAGRRHEDAALLLEQSDLDPKVIQVKAKQFRQIITVKRIAEYEDRLMSEHDAEAAMKTCERLYLWVKENVG